VGFAIPAARAREYLTGVLPDWQPARTAAAFEKEPIKPGTKAPHPDMGPCGKCHTFILPSPSKVETVGFSAPAQEIGRLPFAGGSIPREGDAGIPDKSAHRFAALSTAEVWHIVQRATAFVLAAAVLFNMLGLGGGFFYVPILLMLGVDFHTASATSLFIIAAAHLSALFVFMRSRLIDYKLALVLEPITCLGAFLGGLSSDLFGDAVLSVMFGVILLLTSYLMRRDPVKNSPFPIARASKWRWHRTFGPHRYAIDLPVGLPAAFAVGYLGGILGFAGGVIKVPMMVLLFGVPIKVAIATSCLMVSVTSFMGCLGHGFSGDLDLRLAAVLALAAVAGAQIGARLTLKADRELLKRIFAVVLVVVAVWMIGRVL